MTTASSDARAVVRLAHSPDPDDAFMWWPLFELDGEPAALGSERFRFEQVAADIETLNRHAESADDDARYEITAISCAQYARVADRFQLTACGASLGDGYGPKLVAREVRSLESLRDGPRVAVPGLRTTAFLVTSLMLGPGRFTSAEAPFKSIPDLVRDGEFDAGVVIHEGQLTVERDGLVVLADLGEWWGGQTGLPLPLGANVVRSDLDARFGNGATSEIVGLLEQSVRHAMAHREQSIAYALGFARDMGVELAGEFVDLYVNRWTLDYGPRGRAAVVELLGRAADAGLSPRIDAPEFLAGS